MDEYRGENRIVLRGQAAQGPAPSHRNHGVDYYLVPLRVPRLSGVDDVLNVVTAAPDPALWTPGGWVSVEGEVRSYNNRTGPQAHPPAYAAGTGDLRPAAGGQPAVRPGGLPALHRLGIPGGPLRRDGRGG